MTGDRFKAVNRTGLGWQTRITIRSVISLFVNAGRGRPRRGWSNVSTRMARVGKINANSAAPVRRVILLVFIKSA